MGCAGGGWVKVLVNSVDFWSFEAIFGSWNLLNYVLMVKCCAWLQVLIRSLFNMEKSFRAFQGYVTIGKCYILSTPSMCFWKMDGYCCHISFVSGMKVSTVCFVGAATFQLSTRWKTSSMGFPGWNIFLGKTGWEMQFFLELFIASFEPWKKGPWWF